LAEFGLSMRLKIEWRSSIIISKNT
jgi:hypothetical protein